MPRPRKRGTVGAVDPTAAIPGAGPLTFAGEIRRVLGAYLGRPDGEITVESLRVLGTDLTGVATRYYVQQNGARLANQGAEWLMNKLAGRRR